MITPISPSMQPPNNPNHPACSTPNPPWWCEPTHVSIDSTPATIIAVFIGVLIVAYFQRKLNRSTE